MKLDGLNICPTFKLCFSHMALGIVCQLCSISTFNRL